MKYPLVLFISAIITEKMPFEQPRNNEVFSWMVGAEYLRKHPNIQSYTVCSYGRTGYLLVRTQIMGVYLQNTYDGSKLVSSEIMDTNEDM